MVTGREQAVRQWHTGIAQRQQQGNRQATTGADHRHHDLAGLNALPQQPPIDQPSVLDGRREGELRAPADSRAPGPARRARAISPISRRCVCGEPLM